MPRGIPEYKQRHSGSRTAYNNRARFDRYWKNRSAEIAAVRNIVRQDLETGECRAINRFQLNTEIGSVPYAFSLNPKLALYATHAAVGFEQIKDFGAIIFGAKAIYWMETF